MSSIIEYFPGLKDGQVTFDGVDVADLGDILDDNGNEILEFDTVASAVNFIRFANAATGNNPAISAQGDDTNVSLTLSGKGTGGIFIDQDSNGVALTIDSEATGNAALDVQLSSNGAGNIAAIVITSDNAGAGRPIGIDFTNMANGEAIFSFLSDTDASAVDPAAHAGTDDWITVEDDSGNLRFIPVYAAT